MHWCYGSIDFTADCYQPSSTIRGWEVRLTEPTILDHAPLSSIEQQVDTILFHYHNALPENSGNALTDKPAKLLNDAAKILTSAINRYPQKYKLHFRLAQVSIVDLLNSSKGIICNQI